MPDRLKRFAATMLSVLFIGIIGWGLIVGDPPSAYGDRAAAIGSRVKCPVCQGESVTSSPSGYARDILAYIGARVDEGWTDEDIILRLEERFPGIRLDPQFSGLTAVLWLLPAAVAIAGIATARSQVRGESSRVEHESSKP